MHRRLRSPISIATCAVILLLAPAVEGALVFDHLICRDAKETAARATYSADVLSAAYAGTGCVVKAPAKIVCDQAQVWTVTPAPTNGEFNGRGNPGRLACYQVKCPKEIDPVTVTDAFGTHTFTANTTKLVCVPEVFTGFESCDGVLSDCGSCMNGCGSHHDPSPQPFVCVDPGACIVSSNCNDDSECSAGYACVDDPTNPPDTICCPACGQ